MEEESNRQRGAWKTVVHIEDCVGVHGGLYWMLTLECGHFKSVRRPVVRDYWLMGEAIGASLGVKQPQYAPKFAPKRLRCLMCKETT